MKIQQTEDFVRAVVNCSVCELAIAMQLLVVTSCVYKCAIKLISNPNPIYSHTQLRENMDLAEVEYELD
jgi:hypothetical protein